MLTVSRELSSSMYKINSLYVQLSIHLGVVFSFVLRGSLRCLNDMYHLVPNEC